MQIYASFRGLLVPRDREGFKVVGNLSVPESLALWEWDCAVYDVTLAEIQGCPPGETGTLHVPCLGLCIGVMFVDSKPALFSRDRWTLHMKSSGRPRLSTFDAREWTGAE
jgi:hypothetical protein